MEDHLKTVIAQYLKPTILGIIDTANELIDPSQNISEFIEKIWDIDTANSFGLDIWGRIVGVQREYQNGNFSYSAPDSMYRKMIKVKALVNISPCSAPALNKAVTLLFGDRGKCFVSDYGSMSMRYVFKFTPTQEELLIIGSSGLLPRPAGVLCTAEFYGGKIFGFNGSGLEPFNQGRMFSETNDTVGVQ